MASNKRYYWLKLKADFFKRHDIRVIESMQNGKDYVLFLLKLMTESIHHEGNLRFNDTLPYNEEMLSAITNTNVDIVRSAMKIFVNLGLVEILSDETIYMTEVEKLIGSETQSAVQKRQYRKNTKTIEGANKKGQCPQSVLNVSVKCPPRDRDKSIEKEISNSQLKTKTNKQISNNKDLRQHIQSPSLQEIEKYIAEKGLIIDAKFFFDYNEARNWIWEKDNKPIKNWKLLLLNWHKAEVKRTQETKDKLNKGVQGGLTKEQIQSTLVDLEKLDIEKLEV